MRRRAALLLSTLLAAASMRAEAQQETMPAQRQFSVQRQFTVPLHDGRLAVDELAHALLVEYEFDADALPLPHASVDLRGAPGVLLLLAGRKLLLDTARFERRITADALVVTIDRQRTQQVRRRLRAGLAQLVGRLTDRDVAARRYELELPPELDLQRPLVVLVHGVESSAALWADLQAFLARAPGRLQVATFAYPNDEAVERVARAFAARLRELGDQPVAIVAHSMGGLVARAVIEDPALDPGNVRTLILIGTPDGGSNLGGFRFALEVADALQQAGGEPAFAQALVDSWTAHLRDGLGEAGGDLLPESVCLQRLGRRARNPRVEYHLVLGTRSVLTREQLQALQQRLPAELQRVPLARAMRPRLQRWLGDLDELVDGAGDGVVSVARGRLDGVEPVLVPLDHVGLVRLHGVLDRIARPEDHPVFTQIAAWLAVREKK